MENQSMVIWDRKQNMKMLSTLLEKVQEYNQMAGEVRKKEAEIESVNRKLAIPQKKIPLITKILAIVLCWTILVPVCAIVMYVKNKKDYQKNQQSLKATLEKLQAEYEELCAQLKKYETEVLNPSVEEYVPEHFSKKYAYNASALSFMLDLMTDLRADTIKEAINMYEAELRVNEVINSLHCISEYTRSTAQSSARTAASTEAAAASAAATAAAATATAAAMADVARSQRKAANAISDIAHR